MYRILSPTDPSGYQIFPQPAAAPDTCPVTFTDNFTRANGFVGMNYLCPNHQNTGLFTVNTNRMAYASSGVAGLEGCVAIGAGGLFGKTSQYMKATLITVNAANRLGFGTHIAGEAVNGNASNMQGYFFHCFTGVINLLATKPSGVSTNYSLALAIGTPAANDVFEIQADINDVAGVSNRVRLWQNSVLLADVQDSDASRPGAFGLPGFLGTGNGGGGSTWDSLEVREAQ